MNGGSRIIDLHGNRLSPPPPQTIDAAQVPLDAIDYGSDEAPPVADAAGHARARLGIALAVLVALAWIALAALVLWPMLAAGSTFSLVPFVALTSAPLALVATLWLIFQRSGTSEAGRFARAAAEMRREAAALDATVTALAARLDGNRSALAAQADRMIQQGDAAAERLAAISNGVAHETAAIDAHAQRLLQAATAARADMSVLLATLPKAWQQARGLATEIQAVGERASGSAAGLEIQVAQLADRGREADRVTGDAATRLAEHLARMDGVSAAAGERLDAASAHATGLIASALDSAERAVAEAGRGIAGQGEAMRALIESGHADLARAGSGAIDALAERMATIEATMGRIAEQLEAQREAGGAVIAAVERGIDGAEARLSQLDETGSARVARLTAALEALRGGAEGLLGTLHDGTGVAERLRAKAEDLLVALEANARELDDTLPAALARLDARIGDSRAALAPVSAEIDALVAPSERTRDAAQAIATLVADQSHAFGTLDARLAARLADSRTTTAELGALVDEVGARAEAFADSAAPRLVEALLRVRDTAQQASDKARAALERVIPEAAQALAEASGEALGRAIDQPLASRLSELGDASEAAVAAAHRASDRLMRQMLTIADTTAQVELRLAEAKAEREAHDEDNFARRVSLLLEALNSAAIDVTKLFSHEVADTAWSAYLKGDRGVFTRRAVRLLDAGEAREIARHYDAEPEFREQVNRYIHDFEGMLRTVLASREGTPLGVTLLSSDMGKLYVALAQAIERLRT